MEKESTYEKKFGSNSSDISLINYVNSSSEIHAKLYNQYTKYYNAKDSNFTFEVYFIY